MLTYDVSYYLLIKIFLQLSVPNMLGMTEESIPKLIFLYKKTGRQVKPTVRSSIMLKC